MDHFEFHSKFIDKYGHGLMTAIAYMDLSDEHIAIYSKWADEVGRPTNDLEKMFGRGETATLENCLEDCHIEVFRLVQKEFFTRLQTAKSKSAKENLIFSSMLRTSPMNGTDSIQRKRKSPRIWITSYNQISAQ